MRFLFALLLALILAALPAQPASTPRYVAPYGSGAACTPDAPCSLASALLSGGEVWALPGTYHGDIALLVPYTTLRSVPGTRAKIDGGVTINGDGIVLRDLEIFDSSWQTRDTVTPAQYARYVNVTGRGVQIVNTWVHDLEGGVYAYNGPGGATANLSVRGSLIYNIGHKGNGVDLYWQNDDYGRKTASGNVLGPTFYTNVKFYGSNSGGAGLKHFDFDRNTVIGGAQGGVLIGGGNPVIDAHARNNRVWNGGIKIGYTSTNQQDVEVRDNWLGLSDLSVQRAQQPTVTSNRVAALKNPLTYITPTVVLTHTWEANSYYRMDGQAQVVDYNPVGFKTMPQWQGVTGFDTTSTFTRTAPLTNWIAIEPNADDPHRGLVTVFNWTQQPTVTLDLSALPLTPGATYRLINAENPAEQQTFVAGQPVYLPMFGWSTAIPYGATAPLVAWDRRFGVFFVCPS